MCGIAGKVGYTNSITKDELFLMLPGIRHRGPDGVGYFLDNNMGLLHARLSIIDTSNQANQPLYNENKTLVVICNGEIYNHLSLRQDLEKKGHRFHCQSDSEVLLHLYEEHRDQPERMLNLLKGMFAFALYDIQRAELFLARDRFGIKPLYYSIDAAGFCFASEIKSLVGIRPGLVLDVDYTSLYEYYQFLSIPEPNTIFRSVKALPAGHYAYVRRGHLTINEWYALDKAINTEKFSDFSDFSLQLCKKLEQTVEEHLIADVPIGSFLSAGIDSTMVTHFASAHSNSSFTCISAGFLGEPEDESVIANDTATKMGVRHHTFSLKGGFFDDADLIIKHFDQPFAVSSAFSLFRISQLASREMKVVLTGDGGDEIFAGYDYKYKPFYLPAVVMNTPAVLRSMVGYILGALPSKKMKGLVQQFKLTLAERFLNRCRVLSEDEALKLIPLDKRSTLHKDRFLRFVTDAFERSKYFSELHQLLYVDLSTFLKSEMLYKVDRMTMANELEGRVPFLDHELVELAFSAQPDFLCDGELGKLPLRNWVSAHYPGLGSRPKTGFNTPLNRLLQEDAGSRNKAIKLMDALRGSELIQESELNKVTDDLNQNIVDVNRIMLLVCLAGWSKQKSI